jgi:hypothetical protein
MVDITQYDFTLTQEQILPKPLATFNRLEINIISHKSYK